MTTAPILVTGAGGFVCSEVALALHRAGHAVVATDRIFDGPTRVRLDGIALIEGPLEQVLKRAQLGELSAVIHGAAITAAPADLGLTRAAHIRRNMDALTAVLDHGSNAGASRFLFLSSMGVFNPDDGPVIDGRFTEKTQPTATCAYCVAKQAGEWLTTAAAEQGFTTMSLRLGNIFGPHETVRESRQQLCLVSRFINEARERGVISVQTPDAMREWSWLPDLADLIAQLIADLPDTGPRVLHPGTAPVLADLELAKLVAARVGDTVIRLASPPHRQIRPPMGSEVPSVFDAASWTAVDAALDQMMDRKITL